METGDWCVPSEAPDASGCEERASYTTTLVVSHSCRAPSRDSAGVHEGTVTTREAQMRLLLERVSTRRTASEYAIFDEVSGKCVGTVNIEREHRLCQQRYPTMRVEVARILR